MNFFTVLTTILILQDACVSVVWHVIATQYWNRKQFKQKLLFHSEFFTHSLFTSHFALGFPFWQLVPLWKSHSDMNNVWNICKPPCPSGAEEKVNPIVWYYVWLNKINRSLLISVEFLWNSGPISLITS